MSSELSIRINGVGKVFPVYDKPHHRLLQMLSPRAVKGRWYREFRALSNVDLSIYKGETVGIVGRNGSGKSTLLQIICGTLAASSGSVEVRGRVAALLELGAGFNPDFTGRENIYLNGSVLGLSRKEIAERFDEIVDFADIGDFIEQPVKSYSSGMYVRLAFAVAINVMPDILIVDEALSVGDEAFQRKCFARIDRIRESGATVLFVSHAAGTVVELCNRAILLDRGELLVSGSPKYVVSQYHKLVYASADRARALREDIRSQNAGSRLEASAVHAASGDAGTVAAEMSSSANEPGSPEDFFDEGLTPQSTVRYDTRGAHIQDPHIETPDGRRVNVLRGGAEYVYCYSVCFDEHAQGVRFGMLIKTISGLELGGGVSATREHAIPLVGQGEVVSVRFRFVAGLAPGVYFLNAGVLATVVEEETYMDRIIDAVMIRIIPEPGRTSTGHVDFHVLPSIEMGSPA
jgi:lipopolysaccharide transport system ATP-binding protein